MKPLESDKHYISEYYIRKGFRIERLSNGIRIWKADNTIDCIVPNKGKVREFIEFADSFIRELLEKRGK